MAVIQSAQGLGVPPSGSGSRPSDGTQSSLVFTAGAASILNAADFSIADVLAWARTKPADAPYSYGDPTDCALCQFLRETGRMERPSVGPGYWRDERGIEREFEQDLENALVNVDRIHGRQWTFGALVKRLEKLCPETPVTRENWSAIDAYLTDIESLAEKSA